MSKKDKKEKGKKFKTYDEAEMAEINQDYENKKFSIQFNMDEPEEKAELKEERSLSEIFSSLRSAAYALTYCKG